MRRSASCLALVVGMVAVGASAPPASALSPCDAVGIPFVPDPAEKACEKVTGVAGDVAGDVVGDAAKAVVQPIFRQATALPAAPHCAPYGSQDRCLDETCSRSEPAAGWGNSSSSSPPAPAAASQHSCATWRPQTSF
jgi:hypothetical protein